MALDDPIVWVLIAAVVIFLFGANKIPQFAKAIGQARREFDQASKEITNPLAASTQPAAAPFQAARPVQAVVAPVAQPAAAVDPLIEAAQKEGIDTQGKTRDQIATELAWKLKNNQ
jgi:sec-independent protein translocase protein TatA